MKKVVSVVLSLTMIFSLGNAFAEEEYSNDADIEYGYDETYNELEESKDETSSNYDDINTSYDASYDEAQNDEAANELVEGEYHGENAGIPIYVNGERIKFDVEPLIINNRTMVPLRAIFEALGAVVSWDNATSTAKGFLNSTSVEITIGANQMRKNGETKTLDSPATIISGRTLVPVRAIAESFDCIVNWYDATKTVEILSMD